jgi:hypothetical protein
LNKCENFAIIYIESEGRENRIHAHGKEVSSSTFPRDSKKNNLKSSENSAIIYIESEREK